MAAKDKRDLYRQKIIVFKGAANALDPESNVGLVAQDMAREYDRGCTRYATRLTAADASAYDPT